MLEIDEAYNALSSTFEKLPGLSGSESVETHTALGRYLSETLLGKHNNPPFSQSAMDGIAFKHGRDRYKYIGTVAAGDVPEKLLPGDGECVRIMTGAPVPSTTDTVEMVEYIEDDNGIISLQRPCQQGQHIRYKGENTREGAALYEPGTLVTPGLLAGLLSQGFRYVPVKRKLRIGIAGTGNEIIDYRRPLKPGQIYNSNAPSVAALLQGPDVTISQLGVFPDHMEDTATNLAANTDQDILILSGGVSMGNFDLVPEAAQRAGFKQVFHKIRMKPGKPIWFGKHDNGCLLFGLPGNPVSAQVGTRLYVKPMLRALCSGSFSNPLWFPVPAAEPFVNKGNLTFFSGATLLNSEGHTKVCPVKTSGSGDVIRFSHLQALACIPPQSILEKDDLVQVLLPF